MSRLKAEYVAALIRHSSHFLKISVLCVYNKILMRVQSKVVPVQSHKGVWGIGSIALHILSLGTIWRRVVSITFWALYAREKKLKYPWNKRLSEPHEFSAFPEIF
jgi:hypothetical protein